MNEKTYYYWLRKFRKEAYEKMHPMAEKEQVGTDITFAEMTIPEKTVPSCTVPLAEPYEDPVAVIRYNGLAIGIPNEIPDGLLSRILKEVSHA